MAISHDELREQEAYKNKLLRLVKLSAAAICIVGAASHWQDITAAISSAKPSATKEVKTPPVSSHRQGFGLQKTEAPAPAINPATPERSAFEKFNDMSRGAVISAAKGMAGVAEKVGFHRNSKAYKAQPELEQALMKDQGAQKEVAKMISETYKVPLKTASLIVAKSVVEAKKNEIDPFLVLALMGQESSYNKNATSSYGAQGLMQVVPRFHGDSMKKMKVPDILEAPIGKQIELGTVVLKGFFGADNEKPVEVALQHYNQGGNAKIDPKLKYATLVLDKRGALTATVANYVQENGTSYDNLKPNL